MVKSEEKLEWDAVQQWCEEKTGIKNIRKKNLSEKIETFISEVQSKIKQVCGYDKRRINFPLCKTSEEYNSLKNYLKKYKGYELIKYTALPDESKSWNEIFLRGIKTNTHHSHIEAIKEIFEYKFDCEHFFKDIKEKMQESYQIIDYEQALAIEKYNTPKKLVKHLLQICYDTMKGLTEEHMGTVEQWVEIHNLFPYNSRMLMRNDEIVGYWFFMCLNKETFEETKKGNLKEEEITIHYFEDNSLPRNYLGYFSVIAINEPIKPKPAISQMFTKSFLNQLEEFANKGIFISEWCVNAYTGKGEIMCKRFKMQHLGKNIDKGEMYYLTSWWNLDEDILKEHPDLVNLYKKRFD